MITQTEQANCAFLSEVKSIPGVIAVKPYGGRTLAEQSIAVVVPALRTSTSRQVFELEGEILRSFSGARLDVRVIGLKEHGIDSSRIASVLPKKGEIILNNVRDKQDNEQADNQPAHWIEAELKAHWIAYNALRDVYDSLERIRKHDELSGVLGESRHRAYALQSEIRSKLGEHQTAICHGGATVLHEP